MNKYFEQFMKDNDLQAGEIFKIVDSQGGGNVLVMFNEENQGKLIRLFDTGNFDGSGVAIGLLRGKFKVVKVKGGLRNKDVAKKVKNITNEADVGVCPSCGVAVVHYENYCHRCGQKLDWSEE